VGNKAIPAGMPALGFLVWMVGASAAVQAAPSAAIEIRGESAGLSGEVMACVAEALQRPVTLTSATLDGARSAVVAGEAQGFFSAASVTEGDEFGERSAPVGLEKWYWQAATSQPLFGKDFPAGVRLGVVGQSSHAAWLAQQAIEPALELESEPLLVSALREKRIDAYLTRIASQGGKPSSGNGVNAQRFAQYAPVSVYFSKAFLGANRGFMTRFNDAVSGCQADEFPLADNERSKLKVMLDALVQPWLNSDEVLDALSRNNQNHVDLSEEKILAMDTHWRNEVKSGNHLMIARMLQNDLSRYLQIIRRRQDGLITEIIVMDNKGLNVGISDLTSDYWQGDEDKFQRTRLLTSGVYLSDIMFDSSTQKFQVQASFPVIKADEFQGVVTVGIDVEKALLMN